MIALGGGLAVATIKLARKQAPSQVLVVVAATESFAALSFVFGSPIIAAILLIEATGLGRARLPIVLLPGLMGAAIGSLVSIGMGAFTGLSSSAYALGALPLPAYPRPTAAAFGWTIPLAVVVAVVAYLIRTGGLSTQRIVKSRQFLLMLLCGLIVSGLAIAFAQATGKGFTEVLFSGQSALPGLVSGAGTWSLSALALLIVFKGLGYSISIGSFRGGPTFPAIFLGAAGGIMCSHLPGFPITAAVAVGMGAAIAAILGLPLSAIVIATLLTSKAGRGAEPRHRRGRRLIPRDARAVDAPDRQVDQHAGRHERDQPRACLGRCRSHVIAGQPTRTDRSSPSTGLTGAPTPTLLGAIICLG